MESAGFAAMKIRAMIKLIEEDGWYLDRTRGSHRQYRHDQKKGVVTIAGKPGDDLAPGTQIVILNKPIKLSRHLIIVEETATRYSAYSPDLPGCVAAGKAADSVEREMHHTIEF